MFRQACLRSLMASSVLVSLVFVGASSGYAGFMVDADKAAATAEAQPLGVKKRIVGWASEPVEPVTSANAGGKSVPCILGTKYEEGTSIRFSGGGENLLGISIVKGFDIFKPAYRYPVTVTYAGQVTQRFQATSLDPRTLVIPLGEPEKAYQDLVKVSKHFAPYVTIGIADFEQNYAMDDIAAGLDNLESCYGRKPFSANSESVVQEASVVPKLDLTDEEIEELEAYSAVSREQIETAVVDEGVQEERLEPIKLEADLSDAGEDVEEVVVSEANEETPEIEVQVQNDIVQKAEEKGLYVTSVDKTVSAEANEESLRHVVVTPAKSDVESKVAVMTPMPEKVDLGLLHSIWVSSKGETVETVLRRWSSKAGIDFEWNRKEAVRITQDRIYRGSYEDVTQKLLADYDLLTAVEGDLDAMKKRDVAFAMVEEDVIPEDTISRTESVEDAEIRKKEKLKEKSAVGGFFDGLADIFSSKKNEPKAEEIVATAPIPNFEIQKRDPWEGRKFPENGVSPAMAAVPAAPVQAVSIAPSMSVDSVEAPMATAVPVSTMPSASAKFEPQQAPANIEFESQRWRALKGANLQEVLQVWAEDAGVRLNWKSYRQYAVQDSVSLKVPFDQAVVYTLDQFDVHSVRPMGHLFVRPDGSEAVLTIYDSE